MIRRASATRIDHNDFGIILCVCLAKKKKKHEKKRNKIFLWLDSFLCMLGEGINQWIRGWRLHSWTVFSWKKSLFCSWIGSIWFISWMKTLFSCLKKHCREYFHSKKIKKISSFLLHIFAAKQHLRHHSELYDWADNVFANTEISQGGKILHIQEQNKCFSKIKPARLRSSHENGHANFWCTFSKNHAKFRNTWNLNVYTKFGTETLKNCTLILHRELCRKRKKLGKKQ